MRKKIFLSFSVFFSVFLTWKCIPVKETESYKDYSYLYRPGSFALHPLFKVYHNGEQTSVYVKIFTDELRYAKTGQSNENRAKIEIIYKLKSKYSGSNYFASDSIVSFIKEFKNQTSVITFFNVKDSDSANYYIDISITDLYTSKTHKQILKVDKTGSDNSIFYSINYLPDNKVKFGEQSTQGEFILFRYSKNKTSKLFFKYYRPNFLYPLPPHSSLSTPEKNLKPDSVGHIEYRDTIGEYKDVGNIFFTKKGTYKIMSDTLKDKGITQVCFDKSFPEITRSKKMLETLFYLLSIDEYEELKEAPNLKSAIDNFWLKSAGSKEKASEMLKTWYNRAIYSNIYFSCDKEGWQTDRGMIYMILGAPSIINLAEGVERWIYYPQRSNNQLVFIFKQKQDALSENDFELERKPEYRNFWYDAIQTWRNGQVYIY